MYTTQEIRKAAAVIDQVAEMYGVSRQQVCEALQSVIESGRNNAASSEKVFGIGSTLQAQPQQRKS